MTYFTVKKPEYTYSQRTKFIGLPIIFPSILLWDLLKFGVNKLVGELVGGLVLPAQGSKFKGLPEDVSELNSQELSYAKHTIETHDGAKLDVLEITHSSQKNLKEEHQEYIIGFPGNEMGYEEMLKEMQEDANELRINVIGSNFRGVGNSTGRARSKDDLVTDGIAQVQRLLDQGVSSQNITLKGFSLGAGVASLVARHFHAQGQPINLFSNRSFSSISNVVIGWIRADPFNNTGYDGSFGWKLLGWIAMPFVRFGIALSNWEINAGDAYKEIPETYKDYVCVRTCESRREKYTEDDSVVTHSASLHNSLKDERKAIKEKIIKANAKNVTDELKAAKKGFKERKMEAPGSDNAHMEDISKIKNRFGKSASTFFRNFVQRAHDDHAIAPTRYQGN